MVEVGPPNTGQELGEAIDVTCHRRNDESAAVHAKFNHCILTQSDLRSERLRNSDGEAVSPFLHPRLHEAPPVVSTMKIRPFQLGVKPNAALQRHAG
jgi:hypothetical protein